MKRLSSFLILALASCVTGPGPITPQTPVERQMIGLLQKFDRFDDNGDGYLTASELGQAEQVSGHSRAGIIAFYDMNQDGRISLREAQEGVARVEEGERKAKP